MKSKIITGILLLLAGSGVFAQNGMIKELMGTVELKQAGQTGFVAAKSGDTVAKDTIVSTGLRSSALIEMGSSVITVRPLTRLSLAEISAAEGTETLNVSLQSGRVRVDVNPPKGTQTSMKILAPMAVASVRGTSFEFDTQFLRVLEGTVAFQGKRGGVMMVGSGYTSEIKEDGKAADPIETRTALLRFPPLAGQGSFGANTIHPESSLTIGLGLDTILGGYAISITLER